MGFKSYSHLLLQSVDKWIPVYARDRILSATYSETNDDWVRDTGIRIDVKGRFNIEMVFYPFIILNETKGAELIAELYFYGSVYEPFKGHRIAKIYKALSRDLENWEICDDFSCPGFPCGFIRFEDTRYLGYKTQVSSKTISFKSIEEKRVKPLEDTKEIQLEGDILFINDNWIVSQKSSHEFYIYKAMNKLDYEYFDTMRLPFEEGFWDAVRLFQLNKQNIFSGVYTSRSAWGMEIYWGKWENTGDRIIVSDLKKALDYRGIYEKGGVRDPYLIEVNGQMKMFYAGFWGIHLLMPFTYWAWRKKIRKN